MIVFWVIIVLLSIPISTRLDSVLSYSIGSFLPSSSESVVANNIIEREFGGGAGGQFVIVINGSDVRSQDVEMFLVQLNDGLGKNVSVDSLYSAYLKVLERYFDVMNRTIDDVRLKLRGDVILFHERAYGLKRNITLLVNYMGDFRDRVNRTVELVYMAPSLYTSTWVRVLSQEVYVNASQNIYVVNDKVNSIVRSMLIGVLNLTNPSARLIISYYDAFTYAWNKTFPPVKITDPLVINPSPAIRAQGIINGLVNRTFFPSVIQNRTELEFIKTVARNFNITNWNDSTLVKQFVINYVYESLHGSLSKDVLLELYPTDHVTDEQITKVLIQLLEQKLPANMTKYISSIIELGPTPTNAQIDGLVNNIINQLKENITAAYPKPTYPNSIPASIYHRYVSHNNRTMLVYVTYRTYNTTDEIELTKNLRSEVHDLSQKLNLNYSIYVSGAIALSADLRSSAQNDVKYIDMITVLLVIVLLILSFLSPITPLASLFIVGSMLMVSQLAVYLLAQYVISIYFIVRPMLTVVIMGAGTDYTIYMIYRFYEERLKNSTKNNAIKTALKFGGEAVATSAMTVIIGFSSLMLSNIGILKSIGLSLSIAILIALIISLTFTPSILMLLGDKLFWPSKITNRGNRSTLRSKYLKKLATTAVRKPRKVLLIFLLITLIFIIPLLNFHRDYREIDMLPNTEAKVGFMTIEQNFGTEVTSPNILIIKAPQIILYNNTLNQTAYQTLEDIINALKNVSGIESIKGFTRPNGTYIEPRSITNNTLMLIKQYIGKDNQTLLYTFTINATPSSPEAFNIINNMRDALKKLEKEYPGYKFYITGETAETMDITGSLDRDFFNYMIPFALTGIYIVLLLALRSILTPLRLILTILMSIVWTLGIIALLIQTYLSLPIYWALPIFLFMSIIGLGIDYDIFLVTRTREEVIKGASDEEAVVTSVETTGIAITICGMIMASAFATLLISSVLMLREIGFALSLAVTLDAFIVRILLVPSIMVLMKKWNWWLPKIKK